MSTPTTCHLLYNVHTIHYRLSQYRQTPGDRNTQASIRSSHLAPVYAPVQFTWICASLRRQFKRRGWQPTRRVVHSKSQQRINIRSQRLSSATILNLLMAVETYNCVACHAGSSLLTAHPGVRGPAVFHRQHLCTR